MENCSCSGEIEELKRRVGILENQLSQCMPRPGCFVLHAPHGGKSLELNADETALRLFDGGDQLRVELRVFEGTAALILADARAQFRLGAYTDADGRAGVRLLNDSLEHAVSMSIDDQRPHLSLSGGEGAFGISLGFTTDGRPKVQLFDRASVARVELSLNDDGTPFICCLDRRQEARSVMSVRDDDSPAMALLTADGEPHLVLSLDDGQFARLMMVDRLERTRAMITIGPSDQPVFVLIDEQGQVLFKAPGEFPRSGSR